MKTGQNDARYMRMAIELAKKGIGLTSPNPLVGCLIVKSGRIISRAYHRKAGTLHAEAKALGIAGRKAVGATLYSNLEACTHFGRTPPCTDAIITHGIKRAVFASKDPNPINYGKGIRILKNAGVEVECGVLEDKAKDLNRPFNKFITKNLPYLTVKIAQSIDGKIADSNGSSKWITGGRSRKFVHKLRAYNDAVMIGVNTLIKDDPLLSNRYFQSIKKNPIRVIVDTHLRTPVTSRIFKCCKGNLIIAAGKGASSRKRASLSKKGAQVLLLPKKRGKVNLKYLMRYLASRGISTVLCEGGGELVASLLKEGLVDEVFFFISPRIIGGRDSATSCGGDRSSLAESHWIRKIESRKIDGDILIRGLVSCFPES
ncbi:MAG: bifunctional diaminohydroxyphosphoribosylaminopyrimidine deaminase/5-amino-6-(5-phosphoribosylamino)uracil reductase RibD [Candidatus Omnitrophica bacterium]|nr:bifunctional diaminohydroxyphosphoribosylaminopyrimidine deaminase/5-amino-6-(5-phosphoribosylamino)uracil reductase RibD [Candidatus Omnitrophota bacterium]